MYIFNKLNKYIYYITIYNIYIFYFLFLFSLSKHSLNLFSVFHSDTPRLGLGLLPLLVINDTAAAAAAAPLPPCFTPPVRPLSAARWDVTIWWDWLALVRRRWGSSRGYCCSGATFTSSLTPVFLCYHRTPHMLLLGESKCWIGIVDAAVFKKRNRAGAELGQSWGKGAVDIFWTKGFGFFMLHKALLDRSWQYHYLTSRCHHKAD